MPLLNMSIKHNISVQKTAVYYSSGNIKTAKTIWFVLHGYGMLAKYFIKKFETITNNEVAVIAPEGLSKFYTQGFYGRVGASWMTKEDREDEINDYINYLNQLYHFIIGTNSNPDTKINIVGFSQGGATASRWVADGKIKLHNFILWASVFPDDMNFRSFGKDFSTYMVYGNNDEFATHEHVKKQQEMLNTSNLKYQLVEFEGKHDIPEKVLSEQIEKNNW